MKHYNRETKRWEDTTTGEGKFGKRKECIGGREHDYKLVLPSYVECDAPTPQIIQAYYGSEHRRREFERAEDERMAALGIITHNWHPHNIAKHYQCTRCKKRNYDLKV